MRRNVKKLFLLAVAWLLLVFSYYGNFFGIGDTAGWFTHFQNDARVVVENAAICKGKHAYKGPLYYNETAKGATSFFADTVPREQFCADEKLIPYASQYGAQARVIAFFAPEAVDDVSRYLERVELVMAMLAALVVMVAVCAVYRLAGVLPAAATYLLFATAVWTVGYARNIYWNEWLLLLPFVFALAAYPWLKKKEVLWVFYGIEFLLLYLKLLNGYEYVTTITISVLVPVIIYETIGRKVSLLAHWKRAVMVAAVGALALGSAITTHLAVLGQHYGSWGQAVQQLKERSGERSITKLGSMHPYVVSGFEATVPDAYRFVDRFVDLDCLRDGKGHPIKYAAISLLNYLLLPAIQFPVKMSGMLGVLLQSIGAFIIYGLLAVRALGRSKRYKKYARSFTYGFWVALASAVSWMVLMPGHMYPHAHMNGIIFSLPFLVVCSTAIGCVVAENLPRRKVVR